MTVQALQTISSLQVAPVPDPLFPLSQIQLGFLDLEPSVFDKVQIGVFRQIFRLTPLAVVQDPVSDLLSSKPLTVVPAPTAAAMGVGIFVFFFGFASQCSVIIRSEFGGHALHGCLDLEPSLFDKLRIRVFQ